MIPGSSFSMQMVDHILMDVPFASVYLDSLYYKGHCKVMCVSSPVYPVIIGNVRGAHQLLPAQTGRLKSRKELELGPMEATTMMIRTKVVICLVGCSKRSSTEEKRRETGRRSQPSSRRMIPCYTRCQSPKRHHRREVCCWTSFDEGSGEED